MIDYIRELTVEASEILTNVRDAVRNGEITWAQGEELRKIVLADVRDQAGLQCARELLAAWS